MKTKKPKKKIYPLIAIRVKQNQFDYVHAQAESLGLTMAAYARAILIPFRLPTGKQLLTK